MLQKSEGGALGMGGGGMSGFMTGRSTANLLTRITAILAAAFMATSILLVLSCHNRDRAPRSIIDQGAPGADRPPPCRSPTSAARTRRRRTAGRFPAPPSQRPAGALIGR